MEHGDLAVSVRPHYVIVLEGVLATIEPLTEHRRRWRGGDKVTGHSFHWLDTPLRRLATNKRRFPEVGAEIVTFISEEVAAQAADFLDTVPVDYDSLKYVDLGQFCTLLPYREALQVVYDSDEGRLNRYGQVGRTVIRGGDFV